MLSTIELNSVLVAFGFSIGMAICLSTVAYWLMWDLDFSGDDYVEYEYSEPCVDQSLVETARW